MDEFNNKNSLYNVGKYSATIDVRTSSAINETSYNLTYNLNK